MTPRIGSLCSGFGGLELGLMAVVGGTVAWHAEIDKHPAAVLEARFPGVPNLGDITTTDWTHVEPVDILCAGFPCQDISNAGHGAGIKEGTRSGLWFSIAHAIGVLRPRMVLLENVAAIVSRRPGLDTVLASLAALGLDAEWGCLRAADVGDCHGRDRWFCVATNPAERGRRGTQGFERGLGATRRVAAAVADSDSQRRERTGESWDWRTGPTDHRSPATDTLDRPLGSERARADTLSGGTTAAYPDGSGPQGCESEGRRQLPARRAAADTASDGRHEGRPEPAGQLWRSHAAIGCDATCAVGRDWRTVDGDDYGPAIRRWHDLTRCVPEPTELGARGKRRLNPRLNEWMMGLPDGWVTDVLPRSPALKCIGNGVVPQQAAMAVRALLPRVLAVAA